MHFLPHWLYEINIVYYILNNIFLAVLLRSPSWKQQWTFLTYFVDLIDLFYDHWDIFHWDLLVWNLCESQDWHISRRKLIRPVLCGVLYISLCFFVVENVSVKISGFLCSYFLCSDSAWILSSSAAWAFRFESHQLQFCSSLPLTLLVRYSYQPPVLFIFPSSHLSLFSLCLLQLSVVYVCIPRAAEKSGFVSTFCVWKCLCMIQCHLCPNFQSSCCTITCFVLLGMSCGNNGISLFLSFL